MPIYAYRCATCGHAQDVLQKISDPLLSTCPACGAATYEKQVTAAGFQLKGSGWYVTDFRGGNAPKKEGEKAEGDKAEAKPETQAADKPADGTAPAAKPAAAAATPAAAPPPSSTPAASPPSAGS